MKPAIKLIIGVFSLLMPVLSGAQSLLSAKYEIAITSQDHPEKVRHFTLWRNKHNQVIHQHNDQQVAQYWTLQNNHKVKLITLFDSHQRGIEYAAADIKGHQQRDWSEKWQLLSNDFLRELQLVRTYDDEQFGKVEVLSKQATENRFTVEWLPELSLVKSITNDSAQSKETWVLHSVSSDAQHVEQQWQAWAGYYLTDYADIGDNESDPFLMQMINLGFVEEAASGFYNDKGQPIKGQHSHHH